MKKIFIKIQKLLIIVKFLVFHPRRFFHVLLGGRNLGCDLRKLIRWCWATLPRRIISTTIISSLIFAIIYPVFFAREAQAAWWDENWAYRKKIPVTNNTSQESNVYISVTVDTSDTNKFQTDCGDIRFTTLRGQILPYYIVSGCGTNSTVIHVNFETFPSGAQTIYMYYGNPSAPNGFSASDFTTQASNYSIGSLGSEERGPGPVAYWKFDEGQGTKVYDSTVNHLDSSAFSGNPVWKSESDCVSGKCLYLNGATSDRVSFADNDKLDFGTDNFSIGFWFKTVATNTYRIIGKYDYNPPIPYRGWFLDMVSGKLNINIGDGTNSVSSPNSSKIVNDNTWHYLSIVRSGNTAFLYIDGNLDKQFSIATVTGSISSNSMLVISRYYYQNAFFDEVKIYPYARTADQIKQDYNAGLAGQSTNTGTAASIGSDSPKWMTDGLVGWWKMDETEGATVADASGNGNNGTLTNAQETGTAETESTTTTVVDADNSALSTTDDAYNNMILRVTGGTGCGITAGTERTIQDYTGSTRTFTVAAYSA
ncbi:MAG: DUF2341 domain-containing protein, partial [Candidatus Methanomethylicaceae archaeon]